MESIEKRIRDRIKDKSVKWLAEAIKEARPTLSKLINADKPKSKYKRRLNAGHLKKIAEALQITPQELVKGTTAESALEAILDAEVDVVKLRSELAEVKAQKAELQARMDSLQKAMGEMDELMAQLPSKEQLEKIQADSLKLFAEIERIQKSAREDKQALKVANEKIHQQSLADIKQKIEIARLNEQNKRLQGLSKQAFDEAEKYRAVAKLLKEKNKKTGDWAAIATAFGILGLASK